MAKGSKRRRDNGAWELRVYLGRDPITGRAIQKSRTFRGGSRAADDALARLLREAQETKPASRGQLGYLIDRYLSHLNTRGLSPASYRTYETVANRIRRTIGHIELRDVRAELLDDFYAAMLDDRLAPLTIVQHHTFLSGAFRQAQRWEWIASNPASLASPPRPGRQEVTAPSVEQVRNILSAAADRDETRALLLLVAATTGARRGELCGLRWSDLDLAAATMVVRRSAVRGPASVGTVVKSTKTDSPRRVALDVLTVAALRARLARLAEETDMGIVHVADPYVFPAGPTGGEVTNPDAISTFFARVRDDAGCPKVRLHHLRRFMVSQGLAGGVDVRTVAGRAGHDPSMALRAYSQFMPERDRELAELVGRLLGPAS